MFERFTRAARNVVEGAQVEARDLHHGPPGALQRARGRGFSRGHIPFSRAAKKVLERSLREAIHLGDREIRTEHILLALLRDGRGIAADILAANAVTHATARTAITQDRRAAG